jgi:iron complex outermembrane recepter protein
MWAFVQGKGFRYASFKSNYIKDRLRHWRDGVGECCACPDADEQTPEGDAIVVTGTRIVSGAATSASPIQVVDAKAIEESGVTNIQELLLQNPVFGTPTFSRTNSNFNTSSTGVASIDLRNLGSARTLTLVNGRRFVSGVPGTASVDLNVIPTGFIERVDVLTGGASAQYGSDAVAGVVNFIYRKNFSGLELNGQMGVSSRGDDTRRLISLTAGQNFAEGRGNVLAFASYAEEGAVFKGARSTEAGPMDLDQTSLGLRNGNPSDLFTPLRPFFSGFAPQGRYYTDNFTWTYDSNGVLRPCASTNGGTCNLNGTPLAGSPLNGTRIGPDGFNRSAFRYLAVPVKRYVGAINTNFEISPAAKLFFEGNYARTEASRSIEPFPMASSDINGDTGGQIAIESIVGGIRYRNPFVPTQIFNDASDSDGDGLRDIFFDKRLADFGPRIATAKRDTFRLTAGIEGEIAPGWRYDAYALYGETKEDQRGSGQFNSLRFREALNALVDVNDIDGDGNRTEIICASSIARAEGCIPANVFGRGSLASAVGYLEAPETLKVKVSQRVFGANLSGELFSLFGADKAAIAIGVEQRRETSSSVRDLLSQQGLNGGNKLPPTNGAFDVVEGYAEAIVPILQDRPFFDRLSLRGAVRLSDYSTVGSTISYNYGAEWAPSQDVRFRVIQARSVRAPNVNELFQPPQQSFPTGLIDPCRGITATTTGTVATNCRAATGVNANIAANGSFAVSQADLQGVTSFSGGNTALSEEKGDSFTASVIVTPKSIGALRDLVLTVDYFDIKVKDAIVATPLQFILDQCYAQSNAALCSFVKRRPAVQGPNNAGSLDEVNSGPSNSGGLRTSGIDVTLGWKKPVNIGLQGNLGLRLSYTHLLKGYTIPLPGSARDEFAGEFGASKDRGTATLSFDSDDFGFNITQTYIGAASLDDQQTGVAPGTDRRYRIKPQTYTDAQIRFNVGKQYELYVGANNIFDNKPPFIADLGGSVGIETDAGTYDALGRRFYAGAKMRF